jgi:hypothetical protein
MLSIIGKDIPQIRRMLGKAFSLFKSFNDNNVMKYYKIKSGYE